MTVCALDTILVRSIAWGYLFNLVFLVYILLFLSELSSLKKCGNAGHMSEPFWMGLPFMGECLVVRILRTDRSSRA